MRRSLIPTFLALSLATANAAEDSQNAALGAELLHTVLSSTAKKRAEFRGAKTFTEEELTAAVAEQLRELNDHPLTPARADDTAYFLGSFYRKAGFASARVDYEIRGDLLLLKIDEGPRSLLRAVTFTGERSLPGATLWEYFLGATEERLAKEPEMFPYNA